MVGIDIVNVARFEKYDNFDSFSGRVFNQSEIDYINSRANKYQTAAGLFAVKEAVSKALGTGFDENVKLCDITIEIEKSGKPYAKLTGGAEKVLKTLGNRIDISISHTGEIAAAIAVIR